MLVHGGGMVDRSNHRVRVAAERRVRMRARLLESALRVFGQPDDHGAIVDEVIRRAGVSRGTFYNYFQNADDLLRAVADEVGTEIMRAVAPIVEAREDPAERMVAGIRSWISLVEQFSQLAPFFRRAGLYILANEDVRTDLPRDLLTGMKAGRFTIRELELGFVIVSGAVLAAINSMATGKASRSLGSRLAERVLLALGLAAAEAEAISRMRLSAPELPSGSLIARAATTDGDPA